MVKIFGLLTGNQVTTFTTVLASAGIYYETAMEMGRWSILVENDDVEKAFDIISEYMRENRTDDNIKGTAKALFQKTFSGIWAAAVLTIVYANGGKGKELNIFVKNFGASASKIVHGEYYRAVTALLFHGDASHLVGNIVGIILFGTAVCGITGWGAGWLMILASGTAGNLINAFCYKTGHVSIGASTAVFGAVGILSGYQFINRSKQSGRAKSALLSIACGLALLAFLGSGPYTDIMAHLFGFASGIVLGIGYAAIIDRPVSSVYQYICILITLGTLLLSWIRGAG